MRCLPSPMWLSLRWLHVIFWVTVEQLWGLTLSGCSPFWDFFSQSGAAMGPSHLHSPQASSSCGLHLPSKQYFLLLNLLTQVQLVLLAAWEQLFPPQNTGKLLLTPDLKCLSWFSDIPLTSFPVDKISNSYYKIFLWILFSLLLSSFNLLTCVL